VESSLRERGQLIGPYRGDFTVGPRLGQRSCWRLSKGFSNGTFSPSRYLGTEIVRCRSERKARFRLEISQIMVKKNNQ